MLDGWVTINREAPWVVQVLIFVLGACVGSFLNVCIYRIPAGKSVVRPGSQCSCGKPIAWYNNVPVLAWIWLRGKARCCGAKFSIRYPMVELLTGGLFLAVWLTRDPATALAGMVFISLMIGVAFIDLDHMIIPDVFSVGGMIAGVLLGFLLPWLHGYGAEDFYLQGVFKSGIAAIVGAFISSALIYWVKTIAESVLNKEAMGEGDVVLMGAIGAFCGWEGGIFSLFGGAILGMVFYSISIPLGILFGRKGEETAEEETPPEEPQVTEDPAPEEEKEESFASSLPFGMEVPFGPMLAAAGVLYFVWLHDWVDAYFAEIRAVLFG